MACDVPPPFNGQYLLWMPPPLYMPSFGNTFHLCCERCVLPSLLLMPTSNIISETSTHSKLLMHFDISLLILVLGLVCTGTSARLVYFSRDHLLSSWLAVDETSLHDEGSKTFALLSFEYLGNGSGGCPVFSTPIWVPCIAGYCSPSWVLVGQPPCLTIRKTQQ